MTRAARARMAQEAGTTLGVSGSDALTEEVLVEMVDVNSEGTSFDSAIGPCDGGRQKTEHGSGIQR